MPDINSVEIFAVGTWNNFKFVQGDLKQIVDNTNKLMERKTHHVPIKLGHSEEQILKGQSDGDPALGAVNGFSVKGDKILANFSNMPDILFSAVGKARFTNVSIEMDHIKQFGWFITAVTLLGADLPAVKTLDDLQAFLSDTMNIDSSNDTNVQQIQFSEPKFINKPKEEKDMPEEKNDTSAIDALTKRLETLEKENQAYKDKEKELTSSFSDQETQLKKFKEQETARQFSEKKESILKVYKEDAKAGKVKPAIVDKIEAHLDSQQSKFSEGSDLTLSAELSREIGQAYSEKLDTSERAGDQDQESNGVTPDEAIVQAVAKVRANAPGLSYIEAEERVFESQPQLYADYNKWTENISYGRAD